ncbi:hypothetical protein lerEdw1_006299 [Lerista edwardsae]|nr:hypothetical protein lerEdw1_006299 [Lerista edwardsae]
MSKSELGEALLGRSVSLVAGGLRSSSGTGAVAPGCGKRASHSLPESRVPSEGKCPPVSPQAGGIKNWQPHDVLQRFLGKCAQDDPASGRATLDSALPCTRP